MTLGLTGGILNNGILCYCMSFHIKHPEVDAISILHAYVYPRLRQRHFLLRSDTDFAPLGILRVAAGALAPQGHFVVVAGGGGLQVAAVPRHDEQAVLLL